MAVWRKNILNRSPWQVSVRADSRLDRQFSYPQHKQAEAYVAELAKQGLKARLVQLETSFQLRVRRKGVPTQFITFSTFEEADQARLRVASDLSVSIIRDYAIAAQTTLRELMQRYLEDVVPTHKGADVERTRLRRLMRDEAFVDKSLAALSTEDLQDFITERLEEVMPATADREIDLISQVLRYADDVWKIAPVESPLKGLRRPKYFNERDRRLEAGEEEAILKAAREDENPFMEPTIILALETGMRRGELLKLTRADINFERRYALATDTKNGRTRKVPLSQRAVEVFRRLIDDQDHNGCTLDTPLLNLTPNAHKKAFFERVIPRTEIVDLHFHDLRHEAISRFAESGRFQLIELQAISGHRDIRMLQRYAHLLSGPLATKMDEIKLGTTTTYVHKGRTRKAFKPEKLPLADIAHEAPNKDHAPAGRPQRPTVTRPATNVINFADFARNARRA